VGWQKILQDSGFTNVVTGEAVDTFGGAQGQDKARAFDVYGYAFMARRAGSLAPGTGDLDKGGLPTVHDI
jgi:hypothetical protein